MLVRDGVLDVPGGDEDLRDRRLHVGDYCPSIIIRSFSPRSLLFKRQFAIAGGTTKFISPYPLVDSLNLVCPGALAPTSDRQSRHQELKCSPLDSRVLHNHCLRGRSPQQPPVRYNSPAHSLVRISIMQIVSRHHHREVLRRPGPWHADIPTINLLCQLQVSRIMEQRQSCSISVDIASTHVL